MRGSHMDSVVTNATKETVRLSGRTERGTERGDSAGRTSTEALASTRDTKQTRPRNPNRMKTGSRFDKQVVTCSTDCSKIFCTKMEWQDGVLTKKATCIIEVKQRALSWKKLLH